MYAPIGGVVSAVNEALTDNPQLLNDDPYGEGWLIEIEPSDIAELEQLLDAEAYRSLTEG
jgi:glycine cleavage system H protein